MDGGRDPRRYRCASLVVCALVGWCGVAGAVDLTGRWHISQLFSELQLPLEYDTTIRQSGTQVSVDTGFVGTFDSASGALVLGTTRFCGPFGSSPPFVGSIDAHVAPDGRTFSGTFVDAVPSMSGCVRLTGPISGARIGPLGPVCGNLVAEGDEECDDRGGCCTPDCRRRPVGAVCGVTDTCFERVCTAAGLCVVTPDRPAADGDGDGIADVCDPCTNGGVIRLS